MIQIEHNSWRPTIKITKTDNDLKLETSIEIKNSEGLLRSIPFWFLEEKNITFKNYGLLTLAKNTKTDLNDFSQKIIEVCIQNKVELNTQLFLELMEMNKKYSAIHWSFLFEQFEKIIKKNDNPSKFQDLKKDPQLLNVVSRFPSQYIDIKRFSEDFKKSLINLTCHDENKSRTYCDDSFPKYTKKELIELFKQEPNHYMVNFLLNKFEKDDLGIVKILLAVHKNYAFQDLPIKYRFNVEKIEDKLEFFKGMEKLVPKNFMVNHRSLNKFSFCLFSSKVSQEDKIYIFNSLKAKIEEGGKILELYQKVLENSFLNIEREEIFFKHVLDNLKEYSQIAFTPDYRTQAKNQFDIWESKSQAHSLKKETSKDKNYQKMKIL